MSKTNNFGGSPKKNDEKSLSLIVITFAWHLLSCRSYCLSCNKAFYNSLCIWQGRKQLKADRRSGFGKMLEERLKLCKG